MSHSEAGPPAKKRAKTEENTSPLSSPPPEVAPRKSSPSADVLFTTVHNPSVPPIESIAAPATKAAAAPLAPPMRKRYDPTIVQLSERAYQNRRQLKRTRHLEAFGEKLAPIVMDTDSYDFELPPEVVASLDSDGAGDPGVTRENEGSQGREGIDDEAPEGIDDPERGQDLDLEGSQDKERQRSQDMDLDS